MLCNYSLPSSEAVELGCGIGVAGGCGKFEETNSFAASEGVQRGVDGEEVASVVVVVLGTGEAGNKRAVEGVEFRSIVLGIALVQERDEGAEGLLKIVNVHDLVKPVDGTIIIADRKVIVSKGTKRLGILKLSSLLPASNGYLEILRAAIGTLSMRLGTGAEFVDKLRIGSDVGIVIFVERVINFGSKQRGGVHTHILYNITVHCTRKNYDRSIFDAGNDFECWQEYD